MRVFIINLKRSTQRKELMQDKIATLLRQNPNLKNELDFVFFEAVDARAGEHLAFQNHFKYTSFFQGRELSAGEMGVFASHYKLWQSCVDLNENIIILEDDVEFSPEFNQVNIQKITHSNYKYMRLIYTIERKILPLNEHFFITYDNTSGAQAYFLTPKAAASFIKHAKNLIAPVDDYMDMFFIHGVLNIIYKPFLIEADFENESTIGLRSHKLKGLSKFRREFIRLYLQLRKALWLASHYFYLKNLKKP